MVRSYRVLTPAHRDVFEILDYLNTTVSTTIALAFERDLRAALKAISENPGLGHRREDLTDRPVLFFGVGPYLLIYQVTDADLLIHAVLHGSRDVQRIIERRRF